MPPRLTLRTAYRFFFPLILMTELNAISKSVIHAFLARSATPAVSLAGFNIAFTFYYSTTSATEVSQLITLSYFKHQRCLVHLLGFYCMLLAPALLLAELVAFTSLGDWVFGTLFGASNEAVEQAKLATFMLSLTAPILLARALAFGILMLHGRTPLITVSTLVRVLSLGLSLIVLPWFLSGAAAGAAALTFCMFVETLVAWFFAAPFFRRMPRDGALPSYRELWRFAWPLILNSSSEMGMVFVINILLGRLTNPDIALAAFGVVHGLVSLLLSPVRNLVHTAQTLVRSQQDRQVMQRFTYHLIAVFGGLSILIFWTPLDAVILRWVMGLDPELERYCAPAMQLCFVMTIFWSFSALFRGLMAGARSTTMLAATGVARIVSAALVASAALLNPGFNGAVLGLCAWIFGYAAEVGGLWLRLRAGVTMAPPPQSSNRS